MRPDARLPCSRRYLSLTNKEKISLYGKNENRGRISNNRFHEAGIHSILTITEIATVKGCAEGV